MLPDHAPHQGEDFDTIFRDIERCIMPGVTHWQSPYMHAYFPALNSYPSLLGDMLADGINCLGFTWASSPACTELESLVMDWLGQAIGLPQEFLHKTPVSLAETFSLHYDMVSGQPGGRSHPDHGQREHLRLPAGRQDGGHQEVSGPPHPAGLCDGNLKCFHSDNVPRHGGRGN